MKKKVFVIAEAGVNHNGDICIAKKLIDAAKYAGADAIKFQSFKAERLASFTAPKADYQKKTTPVNENQLKMLKALELSEEDHKGLLSYCKKKDIIFLSSAFDSESVDFLESLSVMFFKVPSGEITNYPFLKHLAKKGKPVVLSTGMSTLEEVKKALQIFKSNGNRKLKLMHCTTEYPAPLESVNLKAMLTLQREFGFPVGYSDHTEGIEVALAAVALGAEIIEKHITLNRRMKGPDHKASLTAKEFKEMVGKIRDLEVALGDGVKKPSKLELKNLKVARKSLVAIRQILKGEVFSVENLGVKRPGTGVSPMEWDNVIGRKAKKNFNEDELIKL